MVNVLFAQVSIQTVFNALLQTATYVLTTFSSKTTLVMLVIQDLSAAICVIQLTVSHVIQDSSCKTLHVTLVYQDF